ncbi:MAG TPA: site-specific DNA-methyltransferase, partial [Methanoregulaceae archaeon]|nr:site-specific DNA-methyltransferase [Methanoregulaceae archaeon]
MDCIDGMRLIAPNSIDVIVTSPPYNIGIQYNSYNDKKNREEYLNWMNEVSVNIERILNENGSLFLNIGGTLVDPWIPIEVALRFRENGFILQNMIHWINSIAIPKDSVGNYPNIIGDIAVG